MNNVIEFINVTKHYPLYHHIGSGIKELLFNPGKALMLLRGKNYMAIKNVSFTIQKGESVALIGRNGAGKSTALGLVTGVLKPTTGKVKVKGRVASMLELGGGFHPELTGRENIKLNATLLGLRQREIKQRIENIIEYSELGDFIDEPIRVYSSGMLAKLGFSVMSQVEPDILIIDEVLSVGDISFQRKCIHTINDFKHKGVTILFVSHNMENVRQVCDRVIWIENNTVKMNGNTCEVTTAFEDGMT